MKETGIFLRKSSGLKRTASVWDVFILNVAAISVGLALAWNLFFIPSFYPGGNIPLASLLAMIGMIFVGLGFYFWSATMPRSGGNYVFLSRGLHPALGFAVSWVEVIVFLFFVATVSTLILSIGVQTFLTSYGIVSGNPFFTELSVVFSEPVNQFVITSIILALIGVLFASGMRKLFVVQKIMFGIAILGTIALAFAFLVYSNQDFVNNLNRFLPTLTYDSVINTAQNNGWSNPGFNSNQTILAIAWPFFLLVGGFVSIGIGSEIRNAKRSQLIGIVGAIIFAVSVFTLLGILAESKIGYDFLGAIAYNFLVVQDASTPTEPYIPLLAGILSGNLLLLVLISIGFIAWIYLVIPPILMYITRAMIAWSLDRVGPAKLADVSTRGTPLVAIAISVIIAIMWLAVFLFTPFFQTLSLLVPLLFVWAISLLMAVIFPYKRKKLFSQSPGASIFSKRLPLFTAINFIGSAFLFFAFYLALNDPIITVNSTISALIVVLLFGTGIGVYFLAKWYRKRQGINIDIAFKEIPVE